MRLSIGPLPDASELDALCGAGIRALINVSGVDLTDIHSGNLLDRFQLGQWTMRDIFTAEPPIDLHGGVNDADVALYTTASTSEERTALREAVDYAAEYLRSDEAVFVCCHRGRGRSPLTAAAALGRAKGIAALEAMRQVAAQHAPAHFSMVSLAAACWLEANDDR